MLQALAVALDAKSDPGDLQHYLFSGQAMGLGGSDGEGQCRVCSISMAVVYAIFTGLDTDPVAVSAITAICVLSLGCELSNPDYTAIQET